MWKSLKALGATSTQGHVDSQASLGAGEGYLPDNSSYETKTKSGKSATRKKNKELLQKHGFDVLGQSFGIPSRVDYEREVLGDIPAGQTARRRSLSVSTSDQDIEIYLDNDSSPQAKLKPAHRKRVSPPPSSEKRVRRKSGQTAMHSANFQLPTSNTKQGHRQRPRSMSQSTTSSSAKDSRKQMVMYKSDDDDEDTDSETTQSSTSFYLPPPPPPPTYSDRPTRHTIPRTQQWLAICLLSTPWPAMDTARLNIRLLPRFQDSIILSTFLNAPRLLAPTCIRMDLR
ncbi:hypothetical protein PG994_011270 [Apiospora phragmitis]|uniref:Uncharacterized protein n=1 Tax=Apiospora phragmitis TaxID=2905665 RepID=A0ABR1TSB5_9PEZI